MVNQYSFTREKEEDEVVSIWGGICSSQSLG